MMKRLKVWWLNRSKEARAYRESFPRPHPQGNALGDQGDGGPYIAVPCDNLSMPKVIKRRSDGRLFRVSHPGYPDYSGLFDGSHTYFFREVERVGDIWRDTGEVWAHGDALAYDLVAL